ncbi:hypothetical protein DFH09DRAFT_1301059 [Mycena vulgaris]|nr:hypothetical protein DFH09DRAFT_1301059 [Mycena vulgaris]
MTPRFLPPPPPAFPFSYHHLSHVFSQRWLWTTSAVMCSKAYKIVSSASWLVVRVSIAREEYRYVRCLTGSIDYADPAAVRPLVISCAELPCCSQCKPDHPHPTVTPLPRQARKRAPRIESRVLVGARSLANVPASSSYPFHRTLSSTCIASGRPLNTKTVAAEPRTLHLHRRPALTVSEADALC